MSNKRQKLTGDEIATKLGDLPEWSFRNGKLHRDYQFADFISAFGFMTSAALCAQALDHHPEWFNVYNKVTIDLNTHDAGGVTLMDFTLAAKMEALAKR